MAGPYDDTYYCDSSKIHNNNSDYRELSSCEQDVNDYQTNAKAAITLTHMHDC